MSRAVAGNDLASGRGERYGVKDRVAHAFRVAASYVAATALGELSEHDFRRTPLVFGKLPILMTRVTWPVAEQRGKHCEPVLGGGLHTMPSAGALAPPPMTAMGT